MSDVNNGVDDYRGKNQMNGASGSAGYSQNGQSYGQPYGQSYGQSYSQQYGQSAQNHNQPMQQQPQSAQLYYQQYEQSSMSQQYVQSSQQPDQQYAQQSNQQYTQQYNQFPVGQQSQYFQSQYSQLQYGGQYSGQYVGGSFTNQYGAYQAGAAQAFGYQTGYANGMFNPAYIEEQARKFSFRWNAKEIISAIIVVAVVAILESLFIIYGIDLCVNLWINIKEVFKYNDEHQVLFGILAYAGWMFPLAIILSFAQVLRKRFFTAASGVFVFIIMTASMMYCYFKLYPISGNSYNSIIQSLVWLPVVIFFVSVEILQWVIVKYKPENNLKYMLVNLISVIISCIANTLCDIYIIGWFTLGSSTFELLLDAAEFFVVSILLLVILPCLVALLLKAVKFTKFLNPEREMMYL
ncbi:hypothetical protein [Gardnerella vaginalis]|uniref:hypothetical protein n=1 Tax=Gardnerella vaginalis TaxID=2702 RepID=UPI0039EE9329